MKIFNIEIGKRRVREQYTDKQNNYVSRWARPPTRNTAEWLDMYSKSPRLAVVERIASDIAGVSGKLFRIDRDGTETEVTNHPFLDFMAKPNPLYEMTSSAIWRLHEIYLSLVGESFIIMERDESEKPVELWNVPPQWVKTTPYLGYPFYDIVSSDGITMSIPVDDMFVMKNLNPINPFMRGLGTAESIADEVEIDEYAAQFQKRFFYNDATPPLVFLLPNASKEQSDEFMARWNQKHKGVENSHKAAALSGPVDVKVLGDSDGKNLGFIESRTAMRDAVLEHFGVPREIMGITENSNRATADSAQYIYAKNVLTPRLKNREEAITRQLLPLFGDNLIWRYDPVIPYDKEFDKTKALEGWNAGLISKNEARHLLDLPDVSNGNVFKVSANDTFINDRDDPTKLSQDRFQNNADNSYTKKSLKSRSAVNIGKLLRDEEIIEHQNEQMIEAAVSRYFAQQQNELKKALGVNSKADETDAFEKLSKYLLPDGTFDPELWATLSEAEQQRLTEAVAAGLLDWKKEADKLTALLTPLWEKAYNDGAELNQKHYAIPEAITRPEFVSAAKLNGGKRVVGIGQTTRDNIADIIVKGVSEGKSQNTLKKEIISEMGTTKERAKLIAQQETSTALATGQYDMMTAAGATEKTWHHRPQKDPRDGTNGKVDHVSMNGETVSINERFSNGLRYPRDPDVNRPEEVINCRCYITYGGF